MHKNQLPFFSCQSLLLSTSVLNNKACIHLVDENKAKEKYARRGVLAVHFDNCDNILAGHGKFTYNACNHSNKVANMTKHSSCCYKAVYLQHLIVGVSDCDLKGLLKQSQANKRISNYCTTDFYSLMINYTTPL